MIRSLKEHIISTQRVCAERAPIPARLGMAGSMARVLRGKTACLGTIFITSYWNFSTTTFSLFKIFCVVIGVVFVDILFVGE